MRTRLFPFKQASQWRRGTATRADDGLAKWDNQNIGLLLSNDFWTYRGCPRYAIGGISKNQSTAQKDIVEDRYLRDFLPARRLREYNPPAGEKIGK